MGRLQVIAIMAFNREISGRDKHLRGIVLLIHNERIFRTQCSNKSNGMKSRGRFTKISEENAINEALGWQKDNTYQSPVQKNFETGVGRQSSKQCA